MRAVVGAVVVACCVCAAILIAEHNSHGRHAASPSRHEGYRDDAPCCPPSHAVGCVAYCSSIMHHARNDARHDRVRERVSAETQGVVVPSV